MYALRNDERFGRYRVQRLLGEGAQGQVFLAEDPRLGRQVAIKALTVAHDPLATAEGLIEEARTVSRLSHRNIVTLYDAGERDGLPYLVLEYVPGLTLEQLLKREKRLATSRGIEIALQMLDGAACAHQQDILHRDIKPANVMIDESGTARLMDFGVAAHLVPAAGPSPVIGSPRYLAPECLASGSYSRASDVYAIAATLYETLCGCPPINGSDVPSVRAAALRSDIVPPSRHSADVDEQLEGIILRGLALAPGDRYASAAEMAAALREYGRRAEPAPSDATDHDTIAFLLRRMQHKKDFPALSESMRAINRIVASSDESVNSLSTVILKDFALTNKLLKVVNSAVYGHSGKVSTISRAVVILGFETVRSIAVTLLFLGHLQNKGQVHNLQEEVIGTLLAGLMARELSADRDPQSRETGFLFGTYQSLGRLLAYYYFYEEAIEVSRLLQQAGTDEEAAARQVLGVTYERLGMEIARTWNFPEDMLQGMRRLQPNRPVKKPSTQREKLWLAANLAEELRQISVRESPEDQDRFVQRLAARYGTALAVTPETLHQVTVTACKAINDEAAALHIDTAKSPVLARLRLVGEKVEEQPTPPEEIPGSADMARTLRVEDPNLAVADEGRERRGADAHAILTAGIQDITSTLVGDFKLSDLLYMVIETMYRGMGFTRVLLAVVNESSQQIEGRIGLGARIEEALRLFRVPRNDPNDLFAAALRHGKDILIADADAESLRNRLPGWFAQSFRPAGFILFPIVVAGRPFGLLYSEQEQAGRLELGKPEADLLITLRNQAVLAIRQSVSSR